MNRRLLAIGMLLANALIVGCDSDSGSVGSTIDPFGSWTVARTRLSSSCGNVVGETQIGTAMVQRSGNIVTISSVNPWMMIAGETHQGRFEISGEFDHRDGDCHARTAVEGEGTASSDHFSGRYRQWLVSSSGPCDAWLSCEESFDFEVSRD